MLGIFLDTETSGLDPFVHVPLELACIIVDLLSGRELGSYTKMIKVESQDFKASDPKSLVINGITLQDVDRGVNPKEAAEEIEAFFAQHQINNDRALFICQNPSFDRPFFSQIVPPYRQEELRWPYHWLDLASMYWALHGSKIQSSSPWEVCVSKNYIASTLRLPPEGTPHRAMNGARHLLACYERLVGFPGR